MDVHDVDTCGYHGKTINQKYVLNAKAHIGIRREGIIMNNNIFLYKIKTLDGFYITTNNEEGRYAWILEGEMEIERL